MKQLRELEYNQIFKPKTVDKLKQKSNQAYQDVLKKFQGSITKEKLNKVINAITAAEDGYEDELEPLAIEVVKEAFPIVQDMMDRGELVIEAKIVRNPKMPPMEKTPPGEEPEINQQAKRRIINAISHGSAIRGSYAINLFKEYLDSISPELLQNYNKILDIAFSIYDNEEAIAAMLAMIQMRGAAGSTGGWSSAEYDKEEERFIIKAEAINFPILVHEIVKGLYSAIGMTGWSSNQTMNQQVQGKVDTLENEPEDLRFGKFIKDKIEDLYTEILGSGHMDNRVRDYFISDLYKDEKYGGLNGSDFVSFIENLVNDSLTSNERRWATTTMKKIEDDLKKDDTGLTGLG